MNIQANYSATVTPICATLLLAHRPFMPPTNALQVHVVMEPALMFTTVSNVPVLVTLQEQPAINAFQELLVPTVKMLSISANQTCVKTEATVPNMDSISTIVHVSLDGLELNASSVSTNVTALHVLMVVFALIK